MMAYSTNMARPRESVKAVANLEEEETVPQRKLRSDGSLELPTRPVQGSTTSWKCVLLMKEEL